ncbi:bromodomain-containing protein DDB_G0280777 [Teleopsis dalmanni]|uniref:bromodomain-containing protein DDB_G0280777 n=1 Tax=Teleopsis dalmanni TaxID=139649 RepID=UPI0018CFB5AE|nr:bromodomain-containing protein DDB_G0280777 [Teleopsis dalmanni]XP_037936124.1 bromodomain-containing protein DDB_G0280777 [Teleopsis dalmanni]
MHVKPTGEHLKQDQISVKTMASYNDDDNTSRTSANNNNNVSGKANNNDDANNSKTTTMDDAEIRLKKQTLEQRKRELEKLLSEKSWLLQQIQKQETQILNGNFEYLNLNEIFANLAQQYKQEQSASSGSVGSAILRRKSSKENNNNNSTNRHSELSNRSSEYDNYPGIGSGSISLSGGGGGGVAGETSNANILQAKQQQNAKNNSKNRTTPIPTANLNYIQLQRQQMLQHHAEQQMLQQHLQLQQQHKLLQHPHFHQQHQQQRLLQQQYLSHLQTDAISLYSVNSANVATLRHQHISPQQQPIVVQCDKYYLSPTHHSYNDGGFIKSSQNIKQYISPLASPTQQQLHVATNYDIHHSPQQLQHIAVPLQQLQPVALQHQRHLDAISLAPSYVSMDTDTTSNMRWRSQTNIQTHAMNTPNDAKSHSSDMLSQLSPPTPHSHSNMNPSITNFYAQPLQPKAKPLDEISISSFNSETQKKSKSKQWLESSLDGPVIRTQSNAEPTQHIESNTATFGRLLPQKPQALPRERSKLSSQSMSSGRHYSMSTTKNPHSTKLLLDNEGHYTKLSQSTSYLNSVETSSISPAYHVDAIQIDIPNFRNLPPKPSAHSNNSVQQPTPPPRPPPAEKSLAASPAIAAVVSANAAAPLSPDIRRDSPTTVIVVQQATYQPYKEVTKPFEMSDFYKYSTKFRQKEAASNNTEQSN